MSFFNAAMPASCLVSRVTERLPRFANAKAGEGMVAEPRNLSPAPFPFSTLITSAPWSARYCAPSGPVRVPAQQTFCTLMSEHYLSCCERVSGRVPLIIWHISTTFTPASGPAEVQLVPVGVVLVDDVRCCASCRNRVSMGRSFRRLRQL